MNVLKAAVWLPLTLFLLGFVWAIRLWPPAREAWDQMVEQDERAQWM